MQTAMMVLFSWNGDDKVAAMLGGIHNEKVALGLVKFSKFADSLKLYQNLFSTLKAEQIYF